MPHAPGHGRYGFGTGMPEDIYGAFSNVAPFVPPELTEEQFRMAMGFVPVAGTAYNWNEMGPWERALSVGLDVADVATLGSGKALTTPLKAFSKWLNPAQMRFLRFGEVPTTGGFDRVLGQLPGSPVPSSFDIASSRGASEPGVSVYKSLLDPKTGKYVLMDAPDIYTVNNRRVLNPQGDWRFGAYTLPPSAATQDFVTSLGYKPGREYQSYFEIDPFEAQGDLIDLMAEQYNKPRAISGFPRTQQPFEVKGNPMTALGSDLETQLYPKSINLPTGQAPVSPTQIVREHNPSKTLLGETLSDVPSVSFDKHDVFGRPILSDWQKLVQQASKANLPSTLPYAVPSRGFDWSEGDFAWNAPGLFGGAEIDTPIQRAEGEGKILSLGALP